MIHNRPLTVYTTNTRRANVYQSAPQDIGQFFERLRSSQAIPFSHDSYMALSKGQQDDLKDVGGFVLGELRGGRRKAGAVLSRCAAVLDADTLGPGETDGVVRRMEALGCCYCIYSTAKHSPDAPRLRIVIPFSEDITADEYEPVTRLLCHMIQPGRNLSIAAGTSYTRQKAPTTPCLVSGSPCLAARRAGVCSCGNLGQEVTSCQSWSRESSTRASRRGLSPA